MIEIGLTAKFQDCAETKRTQLNYNYPLNANTNDSRLCFTHLRMFRENLYEIMLFPLKLMSIIGETELFYTISLHILEFVKQSRRALAYSIVEMLD